QKKLWLNASNMRIIPEGGSGTFSNLLRIKHSRSSSDYVYQTEREMRERKAVRSCAKESEREKREGEGSPVHLRHRCSSSVNRKEGEKDTQQRESRPCFR
ncbi:hypothetical protein U1Q18_036495, partial [Sarracenia purpurea var. burkii]